MLARSCAAVLMSLVINETSTPIDSLSPGSWLNLVCPAGRMPRLTPPLPAKDRRAVTVLERETGISYFGTVIIVLWRAG